jgi:hypothetical protein
MSRLLLYVLSVIISICVTAQDDEYYIDFTTWEIFASEVYNSYKKEHLIYCGEELPEFEQLEDAYIYYALDNKSFKIEKSLYNRIEDRVRKLVKGQLVWGTTTHVHWVFRLLCSDMGHNDQ